jgi:hypothetical protein
LFIFISTAANAVLRACGRTATDTKLGTIRS